ncbi:MAG: aspartyl/asparaginyl beta-hydroxylase domain-containing protein [Rhodothalassiaceae bacterium]
MPVSATPDQLLTAFRADPQNAPLALHAGAALQAAGRLDEALAVWTLGDDVNPALRRLANQPQVSPDLRDWSARADQAIRHHFTGLHARTVAEMAEDLPAGTLDRIARAIWVQYATEPFHYNVPDQRPPIFYLPDLPALPMVGADALTWGPALEAAADTIRQELLAATGAAPEPYVPAGSRGIWSKLGGTLDWGTIYLFANAQRCDQADMFPATIAALDKAELSQKNGAPIEAFFSILKPGAHIPPHCGLTNARLTVHLPLIVPQGCRIRVGQDIHTWREGQLIAFDDSFEHEAWNQGDTDRVVLIFETPHPDLSTDEKRAIERVYEVFDHWVANRHAVLNMA